MKFVHHSRYGRHHLVSVFFLLSIFTVLISSVSAQSAPNHPPVINGISPQSLQMGQSVVVPISYSDPDGNTLTVTLASDNPSIANATEADASALSVVGNGSGTANITVTVDDGQGGTASTSFPVTVSIAPTIPPPNQAPIIGVITDLNVQVGQALSIPVNLSDPEGNATVLVTSSDNPAIATAIVVNNSTLTITGNGVGIAHVVVTADDGQGGSSSTTFAVIVNAVPTEMPTSTPVPTDIMPTSTLVDPITSTPADVATLTSTEVVTLTATSVGTLTGTVQATNTPQLSATPLASPTVDIPVTSIIVRTAVGLTPDQQQQVIMRNGGVETSSVAVLRLHFIDVPTATVNDSLQRYRSDAQVVSVEIDKSREAQTLSPESGSTNQQSLPIWANNFAFSPLAQGSNSALAILDTGVDASPPYFNGLVLPGYSAFEGSSASTDPNGHGTQMAGIALAGVNGSNIQIMPVQVLDADGNGQDSNIINGIVWATDNGADVILMAFSNPGYSSALQAAIDYAWSSGVVLVAATGNEGVSSAMYPAADPGVMGVSATDGNKSFAPFSNYGADVFIAAPGVNIATITTGGGMTNVTGTSAAAANVAGAAAFLRGLNPGYSNGTIVGKLARTADAVGTQSQTGNGQINLTRAIDDSSTDAVKPLGVSMMGSGGPFVGPYKAASVTAATLTIKESTCTTAHSAFLTAETACASTTITTSGSSNNLRMQWYNPSGTLAQDTALSGVSNGVTLTNSYALAANAPAGTWTVKTCATSTAGACSVANTKSTQTFSVTTAAPPTITVGAVVPNTNYSPTPGFVMLTTGNTFTISVNVSSLGNGDDSVDEITITTVPSAGTKPISFQASGSSGSGGGVTWGTPTVTNNSSSTSFIVFPYTGTLTTGDLTFTVSVSTVTSYNTDQTDAFNVTLQRGNSGISSSVAAGNSLKRYSLLITDITPPTTSATVGQTVSPVINFTNNNSGSVTLTSSNTGISGTAFQSTGTEGSFSGVNTGKTGTVTYTSATITGTAGSQTVEGDAGKGTTITAPHFSKTITVNPASLTITLTGDTPDPSTVGAAYAVTWTYSVVSPGSGTPTGNLTVSDGTASCTALLTAGTCNLISTTAGTKTLTASYVADGNYTGSTASSITHTVNKGTPTITWANPSSIVYGTALSATQLNATASVPGTFAYTPALGSVLNVGSSQTLQVAFTPTDTTNYNTASKSVTITVSKAALTVTADNQTNQYGTSLPTLTASYSGFVNGDTAASLDTAVTLTTTATSTSSLGTYPITASAAVDANYTVTFVAGTLTVVQRALVVSVDSGTPDPSAVGQAYVVTWITSIPESGTGTPNGTVTVSDGTVSCNATITTGSCSLTSTTAGSKTLTATYSNDTKFVTSAPSTSSHTVDKATTTITWANPSSIVYGTALSATQLNATASVPGIFVYTPALGAVLNAGSGQTLHVDFTPSDTANYVSTSKDVVINVLSADSITTIFSDQPTLTIVGQLYAVTWQVSHAVSSSGIPTGTVTVSDGTASCTANVASGTCNLTSTTAGTKTLIATYSGDSNFNGSTSTGHTHTVDKTTPALTWENPAAITYGIPLSALQLNATATVPGSFVYTPAEGTVLDAGRGQTLHVDFTLTDSENYVSISKDVTINVEASNIAISIHSDIPNTSVVGQAYTVSWTISTTSAGTPTGTVTVSDATDSCSADVEVGECTLTSTTAGMKLLIAVYSGDGGFDTAVSTIRLHKVDPAVPALNWSNSADITHGTVLGSSQLNATASIPGTFVYTPALGTVLNAGDGQTLHVDFTPSDAVNYIAASKEVKINVNLSGTSIVLTNDLSTPSVLGESYTAKWTLSVVNVGSSIPTGTVTVTDGTDSCTAAVINGSCDLTSTTIGNKTLTASYSGDNNFTGSTSSGVAHVVTKVTPTLNWSNPAAITYGTALSSTELNADSSVPGTYVYTPSQGVVLNAGEAQILHVDFIPTDSSNYASVSQDVTINVGKADLTITADDQNKVYGAALPSLSVTYSGFVNGDAASNLDAPALINTSASDSSDAGTYPIVVNGAADSNYNVTFVRGVLTVAPLTITVTADKQTKTYGAADSSLTYTYTPKLVAGDAFSGKLARSAGRDAGSYEINRGTLALNRNYNVVFVPASLQIDPLGIIITADKQSKTYGAVDPSLTYTYTPELVAGDAFSGKLARATGEDAGSYEITQGSLALSSNYSMTYAGDHLTINPLAITVIADKQTKTYGESDPALTYSYSPELVGTDSFVGKLGRIPGEDTGSYVITQGTLALSSNYSVIYASDSLTINPLAIAVIAEKQTKTYGESDPALSYSYSPELISGDAFNGVLARSEGENVGSHGITQGTLTLGGNYTLTYKPASLTINALAITVTADKQAKTYGESDPALSYSYSPELVSGDAFNGILMRSTGKDVGTYGITQGTLALSSNYSLSYVSSDLTISPLAITVTADKQTKIYGAADPALTYSYSPELVSGDAFNGALVRSTGNDVGAYGITQGTLALSSNYSLSYVSSDLTISTLTITVTADKQTKVYGKSDPTLTYTYSPELVSGDAFNGALARAAGENAGSYEIAQGMLALSSNYSLSYVSSDLTISTLTITVTADKQTKVYGESDPTLTYTYNPELVSGDAFNGALARSTGNDIGTFGITQGTLALSSNYSLSYVGNDLTITPLAITVTADKQTKTYGESDPALTYSYSPELVSGDTFSGALSRPEGENAGSYEIGRGTLALGGNYSLSYVNSDLIIAPLLVTVTADKQTKTYGESDPALTYSYSPELVSGDTFSGALSRPEGENAGSYEIGRGTLALSGNYSLSYVNSDLIINPLVVTVKADSRDKMLRETDPDLTFAFSPSLIGDDKFSGKLERATGEAVGTYPIVQGTLELSSNYSLNYVGSDLTILFQAYVTATTLTTDPSNTPVVGQPYSVNWTVTVSELASSVPTGTVSVTDGNSTCIANIESGGCYLTSITVGTKMLIATYSGDSDFGPSRSSILLYTIGKATPTLNWENPAAITYGTALSTTELNAVTLIPGNFVYTPALGTVLNAGDAQTIHVDFTPSDIANYNTVSQDVLINVNKAALTVSAVDQTKDYGVALPTLVATYSGFVNGDTSANLDVPVSLNTSAVASSDVGLYPIEVTGAVDANYDVTFIPANLTITPLAITLSADVQTKIYANPDPSLTYTYSPELLNGDVFSGELARVAGEDVGSYSITQGTLGLSSNYSLEYIGADLTIDPLTINISADLQSKTYGNPDPSLTYTYSPELLNGDVFSGELARVAGEDVGSYNITQGTLGLSSNYSLEYVGADLTINPLTVTVVADLQSKIYGSSDPVLTYSYSPALVNGDNFSGTMERVAGEDIGSYGISQGTLALNSNYDLTYVGDSLTINPLSITVSADARTKIYGSSDPVLTYSYIPGLVNGDSFSGTMARVAGEDVGSYEISQGTLALNSNYDLTYVGDSLTIDPLAVTVSADAQTKVYGDSDPVLTYKFSPALVNGDSFSGDIERAAGEDVNSYEIGQGTLELSSNYILNFVTNKLTVTKAVLIITADNKSRAYGDPNPALTVSYAGFRNGDTLATSGLSGSPLVTTTATPLSLSSGSPYPIKVGLGTLSSGKYNFSFVNGVLTILKVAVTANNQTRQFGDTNPALTVSYANLKTGQTFATSGITGSPVCSTSATAASPAGSYPINCTVGTLASSNYSFVFVAGTLTINKAPVTITATNMTRVYGSANPTFTYSYVGFKNAQTLATSGISGSPSVATFATETSPASSMYPITPALGTLASSNYSFTFVNGLLTVTKAPLTITSEAKTRAYGDANPSLTVTYAGFKNGETFNTSAITGQPTCSTLATTSSPVGAYSITCAVGTLVSRNYSFTMVNLALTVTKAPLTVTASSLTRVYGTANPTLTVAYSGFKLGQTLATSGITGTPVVATTAGLTSPASITPYPITVTVGTLLAKNYNLVLVNGGITVTKAPITVTAAKLTRVYGAVNPVLTVVYTGFKNAQTLATSGITGSPNLATTAVLTSPASVTPYPVTVDPGTLVSNNYSFVLVNGAITITKAALTITADAKTRVYGDINPALTVSYTGFKNEETPATSAMTGSLICTTTATTTSAVGSYPITCTVGTLVSGNYTLTFVKSTLIVTKAPLVVTAVDKSRLFGTANPALTVTYTGFKNAQTLATSGVTGTPVCTTTATTTSPVGSYPITCKVGTLVSANYSLSFINGTLLVQ